MNNKDYKPLLEDRRPLEMEKFATPKEFSEPLRCPDCFKQDLELRGEVGHDFREVLVDSRRAIYTVDRSETHDSIKSIYCRNCGVEWTMISQYTQDLQIEVLKLQMILDFNQGSSATVH